MSYILLLSKWINLPWQSFGQKIIRISCDTIKIKVLKLNINKDTGVGKTTYPLPANANVLSATSRYFCPYYDVSMPLLSAPIMTLAWYQQAGSGEWWKERWCWRKVGTLIYPHPKDTWAQCFEYFTLVNYSCRHVGRGTVLAFCPFPRYQP